MYQIDNSTAATTQPASTAAGTPGFFTDGNPATSTAATIVPAEWLNSVMMELMNVVTGAGLTASKSTFNQVLNSIKRLGQKSVVLADTGTANAYTATNSPALASGDLVNGLVQQVTIAHANTGASTYAPDGLTSAPIYGLGLQPLQGGELALGGTAVLMRATISGVNSGNPIWVLMECFGGAQPIAPASASQHAVQLGQLPVFGGTRNLKATQATAGNSLTFTADAVVVKSALNGISTLLTGFSQTVSTAAGNGAGKMDTGSAPVNGFVAVYASWGPSVGAGAFLQDATSAARGEQYTGSNAPAGVTQTQLIGVWATNGTGQFKIGVQRDRWINISGTLVTTLSSNAASPTAISLSSAIPLNATSIRGSVNMSSSSTGLQTLNLSMDSAANIGLQIYGISVTAAGIGYQSNHAMDIATPQTIYYASSSSGTPSIQIYVGAYQF